MTEKKTEDVKVDKDEQDEQDIKPGDIVRLTSEALINPKADNLTPKRLFKNEGWPNEFLAYDVYVEGDKTFIRLDPCCGWMRNLEDRSKYSCQAHPAEFFERSGERVDDDEESQSRYSGAKFNGEDILGVEIDGKTVAIRYMGSSPIKLDLEQGQEIKKLLTMLKII